MINDDYNAKIKIHKDQQIILLKNIEDEKYNKYNIDLLEIFPLHMRNNTIKKIKTLLINHFK